MNYVIAFLVGGAICAITQIIFDKVKIQPGNVMVLLVCTGAVLGAIGVYKPFSEWAGAGATVPLLGFGSTLFEGVKQDIQSKGFIGLFSGGFRASAVGISAALILALFIVIVLLLTIEVLEVEL